MSTPIPFSPLNDLVLQASGLKEVSPATGKAVPIAAGSVVTAFLATSNDPTAVAADLTLTTIATLIKDDKWLVSFDGTVLTPALLDGLFAAATPYCIIQSPGGFRVYVELTYVRSKKALL